MPSERIPISQAQRPLFVGVDVGGTNIKLGLVDDLGRTIAHSSIRTDEELGAQSAVDRSAAAIRALVKSCGVELEEIAAIGLGTPGSMDIPKGMILEPPNMPHWRYFPLRDKLRDATGRPIAFANDANAAAFGEFWVGSGQQFKSMAMFTLGTGVGGGIILDGVSLDGEHSFGSELGHVVIDQSPAARLCVWGGGQGQLEAYACAPAVVARASELLQTGPSSSINSRLAGGEELTTLMLAEEAERGDALAMEVILETARYLGIGVVSVVHAIDPGAVIIGGAMTFGGHDTVVGRRFLSRVREEFQSRAYHVVRDATVIDYAQLGGDAGFIGAAGLARELHRQSKR